ncbi:CDP-diacylglycerol--inositol 3-phosphatidyltransferase [Leptomonas pyrrhocoris]|uniref:CDP-diacylglycerol--inositol 3-phosphatidyltransferase n=1 Tax=Leptomonas pyrrhocoris TaxID=157538 RepID=A0A0M9FQR5_LEPPY|nr:CDP-diacylglycerol--inositol 3-phosphatidyltransferase [Leptomonas pyrrhocoris]XP_015652516.1 CDP-diacylglycerol--inositol 3-phosphatidyltransferase [Leptomonas pyrrhocoris]KPA74076.1 CDP-diacylglycerol--inositol 3-phosphatidyltransferase [Leptomonas pyrrhocoris]KPA74077.1 CDP-diacylglycerol--inositol 3-phosphatidyltransferase [Leptomonas pyrrhocoris]|eukprot:XP_015652515.1 CDP-diacylglycerol--inositol 3-phosphatidyltransferase [Leptomonas pyrrhocoris]
MAPKKVTAKPSKVFFFVPNLIGYARMMCSIVSYLVARDYPALALVLYTASFVLDAADGMAARALDQCSHFGAILDMLTDRASTAGFLVVLDGVMQPMPYRYTFVLSSLLFLDVASHFCRMYASLFIKKESHKDVSDSIFSLLRIYYSNRRVMGVFCIGQEFAYIFLYAWTSYKSVAVLNSVLWAAFVACAVPCFLKQIVNLQQLIDGLYHIACVDAVERSEQGKSA